MPKESKRKFAPRFGLRWLLAFAVLASVFFGWFGRFYHRAKSESRLLEEIRLLYPEATFSYEKNLAPGAQPPGPKFLRDWFGNNLFGFVESLTVSCMSVENVDEEIGKIAGFHELRRLNIRGASGLTDLSVLSQLKLVSDLDLTNCEDVLDLSPILKMNKLEKLVLILNGFEDYSCLREIESLKELSIGHPYRGLTDWTWIGDLENLEVLDLSSSRIHLLPPLGKLKRLKELDLTHCSRLESSLPVIELENLTELSIGRGTPLQVLDKVEDLKNLERLTIYSYKHQRLTFAQLEEIRARIPKVDVTQN